MHIFLDCNSSDYDVYGKRGALPTINNYDWRGYAKGSEKLVQEYPGPGTWYIMVRSFSGSGEYRLKITMEY